MFLYALIFLQFYISIFVLVRRLFDFLQIDVIKDKRIRRNLFRLQRYFVAYYCFVLLPCFWVYS